LHKQPVNQNFRIGKTCAAEARVFHFIFILAELSGLHLSFATISWQGIKTTKTNERFTTTAPILSQTNTNQLPLPIQMPFILDRMNSMNSSAIVEFKIANNHINNWLLWIERQLSTNSLTIADKLVDNCRHACRQLSLNPD
jgi:hypothetical protein